jgi:hypothetical protein
MESRGVEQRQLVGLITRRSAVRIRPPQPISHTVSKRPRGPASRGRLILPVCHLAGAGAGAGPRRLLPDALSVSNVRTADVGAGAGARLTRPACQTSGQLRHGRMTCTRPRSAMHTSCGPRTDHSSSGTLARVFGRVASSGTNAECHWPAGRRTNDTLSVSLRPRASGPGLGAGSGAPRFA